MAVHATREVLDESEVEGALLVDATNAFNTLNQKVALQNMRYVCPALETVLTNCYQSSIRLLVSGGGEILSKEGTTQGDPLGMAMFALAIVPLIMKLMEVSQTDGARAAASCERLKQWWDALSTFEPHFGYSPNATKTIIVVKDEHEQTANSLFSDTGIKITTHGKRHLGAAIGSSAFAEEYVRGKVVEWTEEVENLAIIAVSQPLAAAFVHGSRSKWTYLLRTIPQCGPCLQPLENVIHQRFIPALTGRLPCSEVERALLSLPARLGGMGLVNPVAVCNHEYEASKQVTAHLVNSIIAQESTFTADPTANNLAKAAVRKARSERQTDETKRVYDQLQPTAHRLLECASETGASSWISTLPVEEHGFCLSKGAFRDAISLCYGWTIQNVSSTCACGTPFSVAHAMSCHKGGLPTLRHNEIRDLAAELLREVCHNDSVEPGLQALDSEHIGPRTANREDEARLDIRANGFWSRGREAFFDVRVFHPNAPTYRNRDLAALYKMHEGIKKREYGERVREVERGVFTPLVLSTTGGMARECLSFSKGWPMQLQRKENCSTPK